MSLLSHLSKRKYLSFKLKKTPTNHFEIKAKINGLKGRFIVDTGASNTCIDINLADHFFIEPQDSEVLAAGAGAKDMMTLEAKNVEIAIGKWKYSDLHLVLLDLTHVNMALTEHLSKPVEGIIGADILKKGHAIIDYSKKRLYLKKRKSLFNIF